MRTTLQERPFTPTETCYYTDGDHAITVYVENNVHRFAWQLEVDGDKSEVSSYYPGILEHRGFGLATAYWSGTLEEFVPFKITYLNRR